MLQHGPRHIPVYPDRLLRTAAPSQPYSPRISVAMASMTSAFVSAPTMATRSAAPRPTRRSATVCAAARPEVGRGLGYVDTSAGLDSAPSCKCNMLRLMVQPVRDQRLTRGWPP